MNRYSQLISQTLEREGRKDPATRRRVYGNVRAQLDKLLAVQNPRMPEASEARHREELEEAIASFEGAFPALQGQLPLRPPDVAPPTRHAGGGGEAPIPTIGAGDRAAMPLPEEAVRERLVAPDELDDGGKPRSGWRLVWTLTLAGLAAAAIGLALVLAPLHVPDMPADSVVAERLETQGASTLFLGAAVKRFRAPDGIGISPRRMPLSRGAVRITRAASAGRNAGAQIVLGPEIREVLADHTLRVLVVARSAGAAPSATMAVAIVDGDASSGWETMRLSDRFTGYPVSYRFGPDADRGGTAIVIRPEAGEGRSTLEVAEVSLFIE